MSHHGATVIPRREDRILRETRAQFVLAFGTEAFSRRRDDIAQLPVVEWRGRTLYTLRCHGDYGQGPHDLNVPESLLWNLIGLTHYRCVYHTR